MERASNLLGVAAALGFQSISSMLADVVEGVDIPVHRPRDKNGFPQVVENEVVTWFSDVAGRACQQPGLRPDVFVFEFEKPGFGVPVYGYACCAEIGIRGFVGRRELEVLEFIHVCASL